MFNFNKSMPYKIDPPAIPTEQPKVIHRFRFFTPSFSCPASYTYRQIDTPPPIPTENWTTCHLYLPIKTPLTAHFYPGPPPRQLFLPICASYTYRKSGRAATCTYRSADDFSFRRLTFAFALFDSLENWAEGKTV